MLKYSNLNGWRQELLRRGFLAANQIMVLSEVRDSSQRTMDCRNQMDCGERIQTSAANSLDEWINASGPTTVHVGSYPSTK